MTDYWTIGTTALGTGLATAIFTQGFSYWRETKKDTTSARYLAIRLAVLLEKYALDCAHAMNRIDLPDAIVDIPNLPVFPDEESWRTMQPRLLEKALSLAHEITLSSQFMATEWDIGGPPGLSDESYKQCGKCGYIALTLAGEMRAEYKLRSFDPLNTGWNFEKTLKKQYDKVLAEARERNAA